jgi:hypothetical protein
MVNISAAAMRGPGREAMAPEGSLGIARERTVKIPRIISAIGEHKEHV